MQGLHTDLQEVESLQQDHRRPGDLFPPPQDQALVFPPGFTSRHHTEAEESHPGGEKTWERGLCVDIL